MAVNFVSSPSTSVSATAVQTVQKTGSSKRIRAGNGKLTSAGDLLGDCSDSGRLLKDFVVVLASSTRKQESNKGTTARSAICGNLNPQQTCIPDSGMQLAIASLNAATKEFSTLAEKIITITDSGNGTANIRSQQKVDHTNSNNTIVNEKEKTESHIYNNENDDITLDDSSTPSSPQSKTSPQRKPPTSTNGLQVEGEYREVSTNNNASFAANVLAVPAACQSNIGSANVAARNDDTTTQDCIYPRAGGPLLEEKLDKLLDNVVKIKTDMHQKIDRLSRRVDQIKLDVQLNIDSTVRAVYNNVLEVVGIPYRKNENLQQCFRRICLLLGYAEPDIPLVDIRRKRVDEYTFDKTDTANVSSATTVCRSNRKSREGQSKDDGPAVLIEFIFKSTRDAFYRTYSKKRGAVRLCDIGLDSDRKIYVNESLTRLNQKLKSAALRKKRDGSLHAVYTVDGLVYVQQQPGQKGRRISSVADLE